MGKSYSRKGNHDYKVAIVEAARLQSLLGDPVAIVGSLRRAVPRVGDIDLLTTSKEAMEAFLHLPGVEILVSGRSKSTGVITERGIQVDFNYTDPNELGPALLHHTGSPRYNVICRNKALKRGWTLSQHGLIDKETGERIDDNTEQSILAQLDFERHLDPLNRSK